MKNNIVLSFRNELNRKFIHLLSSAIPFFYIFNSKINTLWLTTIILLLMIIIEYLRKRKTIFATLFNNILGKVVRSYELKSNMSGTYLVISSLLTILLFEKEIAIISIFILSFCDSASAIVGLKFGKINFINNKTFEGTIAFILSGLLIFFVFHFINKDYMPYYCGIITIIIVAIIEHITPTKFDNVTIPLSSAVLLTLIKQI